MGWKAAHGAELNAPRPAPGCTTPSCAGRDARLKGLTPVADLRKAGLSADLDHAARSLKAQFKYADKTGAPYVVVLAGDELAKGAAKLRDMAGSSEEEVPFEHLIPTLKERLGRD